MEKLNLIYGKDWQFICMPSTEVMINYLVNEPYAFGAISGFSISAFLPRNYNFTFTQVYYESHLTFLSKSKALNLEC